MNKIEQLFRQFRFYINEIARHPDKREYTYDEILNLRKNAYFRNPLLDSIETWEKAGKPKRLRIKY